MCREYLKEASRCTIQAPLDVRFHDDAIRPTLEGPSEVSDRIQGPNRSSVALTARQEVLLIARLQSLGHRRLKELVLKGWHPERAPLPLPLGKVLPTSHFGPLPLRVDPLRHVVHLLPQMFPILPGSDPLSTRCGTLVEPPPAPEEEDDPSEPKQIAQSVCRVTCSFLRSPLQCGWHRCSSPTGPVDVSCADDVTPSAPSPRTRLSRSPSPLGGSDSHSVLSPPSCGRVRLPCRTRTREGLPRSRRFSPCLPRPADPDRPSRSLP